MGDFNSRLKSQNSEKFEDLYMHDELRQELKLNRKCLRVFKECHPYLWAPTYKLEGDTYKNMGWTDRILHASQKPKLRNDDLK